MKDSEEIDYRKLDPVQFARCALEIQPFDYQAKLLLDGSKRLVACMGRQTGKTTTIAVKAIHFDYTNSKTTTLIVSPSLRQSIILFDRILSFIYSNKILFASVKRKTRTIIQMDNGSQIIALPCSAHRLRGYTAHNLIVDEAAFLLDEIITQILFPMLATTGGNLVLLSTPWGRGNVFYRAFSDPSYSVHHVKSSDCPLISKEFLEEQRRNMTSMAYDMEYNALFVEPASSYFTQELIKGCIDPEMEMETDIEKVSSLSGDYYLGCDLGKLNDYSVIAIVKKEDDGVKLVFLKEFPLETPYSHVIGFIVRAEQKFRFRKILIDRSGVGEAVLDELKDLPNVEGASFSMEKKAEYLAYLRIKMEQGQFRMPYDRRLCAQINEQQYQYTKAGKLRFWHPTNSHDDQLWALSLSVYASKEEERGILARAG